MNMNQVCFYLELDSYLADWFVFQHGGSRPVKLVRGSAESDIVNLYIQTPPKDYVPQRQKSTELAIVIPYFPRKNPMYYNYLSPLALRALTMCIHNRFDVEMWRDLHKFGAITSKSQKDIIYAWMEKNGIETTETNWNAIAKRYQRKRNVYLTAQRQKMRNMNKKKKEK